MSQVSSLRSQISRIDLWWCSLNVMAIVFVFSKNLNFPKYFQKSKKIWKSEFFWKSGIFLKIWEFSITSGNISKIRIFQKPENLKFLKNWKVFKNLKSFQKSEKFPKILKVSKNLKSFQWPPLRRFQPYATNQLESDKGVSDLHEFIPTIGGTTLYFRKGFS